MATSSHLGFTYISQSQSQKEVTANAAFLAIDALLNTGVIDKDLTAPPGSPSNGDVYIVGASATGDWAGQDGDIAYYEDAWYFIDPNEGLVIWVSDEDSLYAFDGTNWVAAGGTIQNAALIGINTTADATNKLAVASAATLFTNIGNGHQVKVNKAASGDTASFLFQTNFSASAEFGTTGDDDFHFKVSPDNFTTTYEAFVIDKDNGNTAFKDGFIGIGAPTSLTIATGAITATKSYIAVDTESAAASDDLDTINGGVQGALLIIKAADDTHTVVCKDGTGNLKLAGGDFSLDSVNDSITFIYDGTNWIEIARANND